MRQSVEYKKFTIITEPDGEMVLAQIIKPDGESWVTWLTGSIPDAYNRAFELVDIGEDVIISTMDVTKERQLQIGDIVSIRITPKKKSASIGIIEKIQDAEYFVCHLKQVDGFYQKVTSELIYQLENLSLYPNREKWVRIKRDLDRQKDGEILTNWIRSL